MDLDTVYAKAFSEHALNCYATPTVIPSLDTDTPAMHAVVSSWVIQIHAWSLTGDHNALKHSMRVLNRIILMRSIRLATLEKSTASSLDEGVVCLLERICNSRIVYSLQRLRNACAAGLGLPGLLVPPLPLPTVSPRATALCIATRTRPSVCIPARYSSPYLARAAAVLAARNRNRYHV